MTRRLPTRLKNDFDIVSQVFNLTESFNQLIDYLTPEERCCSKCSGLEHPHAIRRICENISCPCHQPKEEMLPCLRGENCTDPQCFRKRELELIKRKEATPDKWEEVIKRIENVKAKVQMRSGTNKWDSCYDDCLEIIKELK